MLHPCSTPELLPTAFSLYLILDFIPACYHCRQQTHHAIKRIRAGLSAASQRLDGGGHMQQPFQLANSFQCNAATRPSLPHVFSTGILARVGILADLAIPCFCLKPLSHTMTAPFLPPLSSVRRSALYPRAICSGQISVHRGGKLGFSSGFVPC